MIGARMAYDIIAHTAGPLVAQREPLLILMYHCVQDYPAGADYVPASVFRQHIAYLADQGYKFLAMRQVYENWPAVLTGPKSVVLTFDDLWASQVDTCLPVLKAHGCTGTFFVSTAHVGDRRRRPDGRPFGRYHAELGCWADVETLERNGMEIGAHTHTHPNMSRLGRDQVHAELATSNRILAGIVRAPVVSFAFPYGKPGAYAPWMIPMLPAFGYKTACTTRWGRPVAGSHLLELPRIAIDGADDLRRFAMKLRGCYDFLRWRRR